MNPIDKEKLDELKKSQELDNSELERLMEFNIETASLEEQNVFLDKFKESRLLLPVSFNPKIFEEIEGKKVGETATFGDDIGFNINYLTDDKGNRVVPLFTSDEIMRQADLMSSTMVFYMADLADMLKQTDKYTAVAINPFHKSNINMPMGFFLSLFLSDNEKELMKSLDIIFKLLKEKSTVLKQDTAFMLRGDKNIMKDNATDGIFIPVLPFNVSSNPELHKDLKYSNIILMPKGKKILFIGDLIDKNGLDTVIAPESEFHFVEDVDDCTSVWKCDKQPFYED